jgi:poly-D-alanine transfer protein DltD
MKQKSIQESLYNQLESLAEKNQQIESANTNRFKVGDKVYCGEISKTIWTIVDTNNSVTELTSINSEGEEIHNFYRTNALLSIN